MANGRVKVYDAGRGYGFIEQDDGAEDVFLHASAVEQAGLPPPAVGERLIYDVTLSRDGRPFATNLDLE